MVTGSVPENGETAAILPAIVEQGKHTAATARASLGIAQHPLILGLPGKWEIQLMVPVVASMRTPAACYGDVAVTRTAAADRLQRIVVWDGDFLALCIVLYLWTHD
jgi:hypothetical protein